MKEYMLVILIMIICMSGGIKAVHWETDRAEDAEMLCHVPRAAFVVRKTCFVLTIGSRTFKGADRRCRLIGYSQLAMIRDEATYLEILPILRKQLRKRWRTFPEVWIGRTINLETKEESSLNGTVATWSKWYPGSPRTESGRTAVAWSIPPDSTNLLHGFVNHAPSRIVEAALCEYARPIWTEWQMSDCSVTIGDGVRTKSRVCLQGHCERESKRTYPCNEAVRPGDCPGGVVFRQTCYLAVLESKNFSESNAACAGRGFDHLAFVGDAATYSALRWYLQEVMEGMGRSTTIFALGHAVDLATGAVTFLNGTVASWAPVADTRWIPSSFLPDDEETSVAWKLSTNPRQPRYGFHIESVHALNNFVCQRAI